MRLPARKAPACSLGPIRPRSGRPERPAALLRRATASPKEAMLPHSETLVRFSAVKDEENPAKLNAGLEAPCQAEPTVVFGLRPCDARGFVVLDRPYMHGKFKDPYYTARREATVIVTQACPTAMPTCFCHWVGSHPADAEGSDVLFTAVDGGYVLAGISDKGRALLDGAGFADGDDKQAAVEVAHKTAAEALCPPSRCDIPGPKWRPFTVPTSVKRRPSVCPVGPAPTCAPLASASPSPTRGRPWKAAVCAVGIHACRLSSRWKPAVTIPARKNSSACATASVTSSAITPSLTMGRIPVWAAADA